MARITYRRIITDKDRREARQLVQRYLENIGEDRIPSLAVERQTPGRLNVVYGAWEEQHLVGAGWGRNTLNLRSPEVFILVQVAVAPSYRNRGIGKHLVKLRETFAEQHGCWWCAAIIADTPALVHHAGTCGYKLTDPGQEQLRLTFGTPNNHGDLTMTPPENYRIMYRHLWPYR